MNPITSVWQFHVKLVGIIKYEGHGLQVNYIAVLVQPLHKIFQYRPARGMIESMIRLQEIQDGELQPQPEVPIQPDTTQAREPPEPESAKVTVCKYKASTAYLPPLLNRHRACPAL